ncbi:MAG: YheU family protein [Desulfobacterales bacterium]|nr:YheU family protein [Desulfobacterales bacterium]
MAVVIPHDRLSKEALNGVIEEFVTRDGTDYGPTEVSLETKISQIRAQLNNKTAVIVFDSASQTCNILPANDPALKNI